MTLGAAAMAYMSIALTSHPERPAAPAMTQAEVLAQCDTGDLLFFIYKKAPKWFLSASPITHLSVIVRDSSGRPLSVETHAANGGPDGTTRDGINAWPLEGRLVQDGVSRDLFLVKMIGPRVEEYKIDNLLASLPALREKIKYNYKYVQDEVTCRMTFGKSDISRSMHCANFASYVLQKLGIARLDQRTDCIRPVDVAWLKLLDGRAYVSQSPVSG
jgi:hypothetical protein